MSTSNFTKDQLNACSFVNLKEIAKSCGITAQIKKCFLIELILALQENDVNRWNKTMEESNRGRKNKIRGDMISYRLPGKRPAPTIPEISEVRVEEVSVGFQKESTKTYTNGRTWNSCRYVSTHHTTLQNTPRITPQNNQVGEFPIKEVKNKESHENKKSTGETNSGILNNHHQDSRNVGKISTIDEIPRKSERKDFKNQLPDYSLVPASNMRYNHHSSGKIKHTQQFFTKQNSKQVRPSSNKQVLPSFDCFANFVPYRNRNKVQHHQQQQGTYNGNLQTNPSFHGYSSEFSSQQHFQGHHYGSMNFSEGTEVQTYRGALAPQAQTVQSEMPRGNGHAYPTTVGQLTGNIYGMQHLPEQCYYQNVVEVPTTNDLSSQYSQTQFNPVCNESAYGVPNTPNHGSTLYNNNIYNNSGYAQNNYYNRPTSYGFYQQNFPQNPASIDMTNNSTAQNFIQGTNQLNTDLNQVARDNSTNFNNIDLGNEILTHDFSINDANMLAPYSSNDLQQTKYSPNVFDDLFTTPNVKSIMYNDATNNTYNTSVSMESMTVSTIQQTNENSLVASSAVQPKVDYSLSACGITCDVSRGNVPANQPTMAEDFLIGMSRETDKDSMAKFFHELL